MTGQSAKGTAEFQVSSGHHENTQQHDDDDSLIQKQKFDEHAQDRRQQAEQKLSFKDVCEASRKE